MMHGRIAKKEKKKRGTGIIVKAVSRECAFSGSVRIVDKLSVLVMQNVCLSINLDLDTMPDTPSIV